MQNHSYENEFDLHENETACRTHLHMKGFSLRLVLKQRHKRTRKLPITVVLSGETVAMVSLKSFRSSKIVQLVF